MSEQIVTATVFEVNTEVEFPHVCRDCGNPLHVIQQENSPRIGGYMVIVTCWVPGCLLKSVTLSVEQYNSLTEKQLEAYREMNRARANGQHAVGARC